MTLISLATVFSAGVLVSWNHFSGSFWGFLLVAAIKNYCLWCSLFTKGIESRKKLGLFGNRRFSSSTFAHMRLSKVEGILKVSGAFSRLLSLSNRTRKGLRHTLELYLRKHVGSNLVNVCTKKRRKVANYSDGIMNCKNSGLRQWQLSVKPIFLTTNSSNQLNSCLIRHCIILC